MKLEDVITCNYNLNIISINKNLDSTDGNVYNIVTSSNKYIAKIYDDINKANNMINLHNYLKSVYIPKIVKSNDNEYLIKYDDKYIVIYTFLEGLNFKKFISENKCSEKIISSIATEVRKIHNLTAGKTFDLDTVDFANNLSRKSVLHFDLTKENIFVNDNQVGFIDFDDAKYGDSVCDVAILLSFLFVSKKRGIDNKSINLFLDSYYKGDSDELRTIEQKYIKLYIKKWVEYILNGHEFDTSLKDSFEFKKMSANFIEIKGVEWDE